MKAFLIVIGKAAESYIPILMTAVSSGMTKNVPEIFVHEISEGTASALITGLADDIDSIAEIFDRHGSQPFCNTAFHFTFSHTELPDRNAMASDDLSAKLMDTLRGKSIPLSFHTDREAVEWASEYLFRLKGPEQFLPASFLGTLAAAASDTSKPVPRLLLLCDPGDTYSSGMTFALLRFLASAFNTRRPFTCLIMAPQNPSSDQSRTITKQTLRKLSSDNLVRDSSDGADAAPADAAWLVACPSGLSCQGGGQAYTGFAVSRIIAELFALNVFPEPGLHIHQSPIMLNAQSLGDEYTGAAQFFKFAIWMLTSLLDRIRDSVSHNDRRLAISSAFRSRPFRTFFRPEDDILPFLRPLERFLTAYLSQCLLIFRDLPDLMRSEQHTAALWRRAVHCCGHYITNAAEYSVSFNEAEESGITLNMPVHRGSLADTDEEIIIQKLEKMKANSASALHERDVCFSEIGHTLAFLALKDCLDKCRGALQSAKARLSELPRTGEAVDNLNIRLQERRIKYLEDAVSISLEDLRSISRYESLTSLTPSRPSVGSDFANQFVSDKALEALEMLLAADNQDKNGSQFSEYDRESAVRALTANLPILFTESDSADEKALMKALVNDLRTADTDRSLAFFLNSAFSACAPGTKSAIPLGQAVPRSISALEFAMLPDLAFSDEPLSMSNISERLIVADNTADLQETRGLIAFLILSQYRETGPRDTGLVIEPITRGSSVFISACLDAFHVQEAMIVMLSHDDKTLPLCLLIPGRLPILPVWTDEHKSMLPDYVIWHDPETGRLTDPSSLLCETDRSILSCQLTAIRAAMDAKVKSRIDSFIQTWHRDLARASRNLKDMTDALLSIRLSGVCGLYRLGGYGELLRTEYKYRNDLKEDRISAYIADSASLRSCQAAMRSDIVYTWRGIPFARESSAALLESLHAAEEGPVLNSLDDECRLLFRSSDNYRDSLIAGISELLSKYPKSDERSRSVALDLKKNAAQPITEGVTTLTVPFDEKSAALNAIIRECLGERLAKAALHPFSDLMLVFPAKAGQIIGDNLLSKICSVEPEHTVPSEDPHTASSENPDSQLASSPFQTDTDAHPKTAAAADAVLPPLSPEMASSLTILPEGTRLLEQDFLRFERRPGCIRAELLLNGAFPLKLVRDYRDQEIVYLYSDDIPTAALWPAVPFEPEHWKKYYAFAHCSDFFRLSVICASGKETALTLSVDGRACAAMPQYPVCMIFRHDEKTAGALPNILPVPSRDVSIPVSVCIDTGSFSTSVVLQTPEGPRPLTGSNMLRLLISHPVNATELLRKEFIPSLPPSSFFPNVLSLHAGLSSPTLFPLNATAPSPLTLSDLLSDNVLPGLSPMGSGTDAFKEYIHDIMLQAALQVRISGASEIVWKFALPEQDTPDRRRETAQHLESAADTVATETGLSSPEKGTTVSYAAQSAALGAYFRLSHPNETSGGFVILDTGHSFTSCNVFLRGQDSAVWSERRPLSLPDTLLPFLINSPELFRQDFSFTGNDKLISDIRQLEELLARASDSASSMRRACSALGLFIADNAAIITDAALSRAQGGSPSGAFSILLAHLCWTITLTGLLINAAVSSASGARELPDTIPLFISGMGSRMFETLPNNYQVSVFSFLTLFESSGLKTVFPIFSSDRKLEIPIGLGLIQTGAPERIIDRGGTVPLPASPDTIISGFLRMFRTVFPNEAELLFPAFFAQDIYNSFTPYAQDMIAAAVGRSFANAETHTGYACLSSCLGDLFRLLIDSSRERTSGGYEWNA